MKLHYFTPEEFGDYYSLCAPELLIRLDVFRHIYGQPVQISPHPAAIARTTGQSWHNYKIHKQVMAIDVIPKNMRLGDNPYKACNAAKLAGFTGIGIYPQWTLNDKTVGGLHADIRTDRHPNDPATWGGINIENTQTYVSINKAFNHFG